MAARHVHGPMFAAYEDDGGDMALEGDGAGMRFDQDAAFDASPAYTPPPRMAFKSARATRAPLSPSPVAQPTRSPAADIESALATTQSADGSFGGDVGRTAAALVAFVVLGHTSRRGSRRRVVQKAARWLDAHRGVDAADLALAILARVEAGGARPEAAELLTLVAHDPEGRLLSTALAL
jgi:hypothetical protein